MTEDTVVALCNPGASADPLTEVLRAGAREFLAQAIEAEVAAVLTAHEHLKTEDGHWRLVRHGNGPERAILTGIGPVSVRRPEGPGPWWCRGRAHPFHLGHSAPFRAVDALARCGIADALPSRRVQRGLPGGAGGPARQGRPWLVGAGDRPPAVRHRTVRAKGCLSHGTALAMVFKLITTAGKAWRRLTGNNQLPKVIEGVTIKGGMQADETETRAAA